MSMSVGRPRKGVIAEINVTPMADVMIVLLIIFMVTIPIVTQAPVQLPSARSVVEQPGEQLEIVVRSDGSISVGQDSFPSVESLTDFLAVEAANPTPPRVLIEGDRGVSFADVARVLTACRRAGSQEVALAARKRLGN